MDRSIRGLCAIFAAAWSLGAATPVAVADTVRKINSSTTGDVVSVSAFEVVIEQSGKGREKVPVSEILTVYYDGDPSALQNARSQVLRGAYQDALELLEKIETDKITRKEIRQDVEFYQALCAAKLALEGTGAIGDAGSRMWSFVQSNEDSYHYLQACEIVGDLFLSRGDYANAERFYGRLAKAPWAEYKMRSGVAIGRARLALGKTAEALEAFDGVLAIDAQGDQQRFQQTAALLGKARCLADDNKHDQALKMVDEVLEKLLAAEPEPTELLAMAYNTQGKALRAAGKPKDALMAFLHVDILYFAAPDAHAEALANLAELWNEIHKTERAVAARRMLEQQYGNSRWAK